MAKCFLCGSDVIWNCDFSYDDYAIDGDGIVSTWSCSGCGAEYEVYQNLEEEKKPADDGSDRDYVESIGELRI